MEIIFNGSVEQENRGGREEKEISRAGFVFVTKQLWDTSNVHYRKESKGTS